MRLTSFIVYSARSWSVLDGFRHRSSSKISIVEERSLQGNTCHAAAGFMAWEQPVKTRHAHPALEQSADVNVRERTHRIVDARIAPERFPNEAGKRLEDFPGRMRDD